MSLLESPKVREAIERETQARDLAFLGAPFVIEGQRLKPFTLSHYLTLQLSGNPFVCGGVEPVASDAACFLYVVTDSEDSPADYAASIGHLDFMKVCEGIVRYLEEAFFDAPGSDTKTKGSSERSYYSLAASLSDHFGREYGWSVQTVMQTPLGVLFQLMRVSQKRNDPTAPMFNKLSDSAIQSAIQEANA